MRGFAVVVVLVLLSVLLPFSAQAADSGAKAQTRTREVTYEKFLYALRIVESGDNIKVKDGDGGKAIGTYQIWRCYFQDAVEYDKTLKGLTYEDCRNREKATKVVEAYLRRYAKKAWEAKDWQTLARIHNGGPSGHKKEATRKYWARVQKALNKS